MTGKYPALVLGLLAFLLVALPLQQAEAQVTRTLTIQDGEVYIDGQEIPGDELPPELNIEGVAMQHSFAGVERPVIEIGGELYALEDQLVPVDERSADSEGMTIFFEHDARSPNGESLANNLPTQILQSQYLEEIQRHSQQLYEQLMREQHMEAQTRDLAQNIRSLGEGSERQQYIDSLRSTLNEIFDLKQENRQREIEQLEAQLQELRQNLQEREQMREQMIDRRIQQLIGDDVN